MVDKFENYEKILTLKSYALDFKLTHDIPGIFKSPDFNYYLTEFGRERLEISNEKYKEAKYFMESIHPKFLTFRSGLSFNIVKLFYLIALGVDGKEIQNDLWLSDLDPDLSSNIFYKTIEDNHKLKIVPKMCGINQE